MPPPTRAPVRALDGTTDEAVRVALGPGVERARLECPLTFG
jgi:hypothetical protein